MKITDISVDTTAGAFAKIRLLFAGGEGEPCIKVYLKPARNFEPSRPAFVATASITDDAFKAFPHPVAVDAPALAAGAKGVTLGLTNGAVRVPDTVKPSDKTKAKGRLTISGGRLYECRRVDDGSKPFAGATDLAWTDMGPVGADVSPAWCDIQRQLVPVAAEVAEAAAHWWQRMDALRLLGPIPA